MQADLNMIIEKLIRRAETRCPGSLALIGVYGSICTGDIHPKSDLDLLIVIHDDRGWAIGDAFLLTAEDVGYDFYCTPWSALEKMSTYPDPQISKLMDSKILYHADEASLMRLMDIREKARTYLAKSMDMADFEKAAEHLNRAKIAFANIYMGENLSDTRFQAGLMIHALINAVMMINKKYFTKGVKRTYEELAAVDKLPIDFIGQIETIVGVETREALISAAGKLLKTSSHFFAEIRAQVETPKAKPAAGNLKGTYEELFSNWRNKTYEAAELDHKYHAFMAFVSCQNMLNELASEIGIKRQDVMSKYDPNDLSSSAKGYDEMLAAYYAQNYVTHGLSIRRFETMEEALKDL